MTEVTMICGPPRAMMSAFDIILVLCCGELSRLKPLIRIPMAIAYALHLQASSSRVHPQTLPPPPPPPLTTSCLQVHGILSYMELFCLISMGMQCFSA